MTDVSILYFRMMAGAAWVSVWFILIDDSLFKSLSATPDHDLLKIIGLLLMGIFSLLAVDRIKRDR